jgi:16S rRNA (cytosine1402-N4)-methyltransferase
LDGILLDLGVSSRQLDDPSKGFTYRQDAPLDMRMDPGLPESAADLLARLDGPGIADLLRELGEVRHARSIAREIVRRREQDPLRRSGQLREAVEANTPPPHRSKVLSQVFQALRIAVNDELGELDRALETSEDLLAPGGRLVVIAYHSLEDRRVKRFMREASAGCTCPPDLPVCVCGADPVFRLPERRAVKASDEEVAVNPRARSARLRWAERTAGEARR